MWGHRQRTRADFGVAAQRMNITGSMGFLRSCECAENDLSNNMGKDQKGSSRTVCLRGLLESDMMNYFKRQHLFCPMWGFQNCQLWPLHHSKSKLQPNGQLRADTEGVMDRWLCCCVGSASNTENVTLVPDNLVVPEASSLEPMSHSSSPLFPKVPKAGAIAEAQQDEATDPGVTEGASNLDTARSAASVNSMSPEEKEHPLN
eukprot:s63_g12.t1